MVVGFHVDIREDKKFKNIGSSDESLKYYHLKEKSAVVKLTFCVYVYGDFARKLRLKGYNFRIIVYLG